MVRQAEIVHFSSPMQEHTGVSLPNIVKTATSLKSQIHTSNPEMSAAVSRTKPKVDSIREKLMRSRLCTDK
jgi:hypothetical protein